MPRFWSAIRDALTYRRPGKVLLPCPKCGRSLGAALSDERTVTLRCITCRHQFPFNRKKRGDKETAIALAVVSLSWIFLALSIVMPFVLSPRASKAPEIARRQYEDTLERRRVAFVDEVETKKRKYSDETKKINPGQLRLAADRHYAAIWDARAHYNDKFAVTPREKAQLEMLALSKQFGQSSGGSTATLIKQIATKAAPNNSTIQLIPSAEGYRLDIDFDMSELAPGEKGTSTQHSSIESLRSEAVALDSRVLNDVYQWCGKMELASISIGLRHQVRQMINGSYSGDETTVIYKIRLDRRNLQELKNNPFLNTYSTARDFKIVKNEFPTLRLVPAR